jgi:hypothetical protein
MPLRAPIAILKLLVYIHVRDGLAAIESSSDFN